jgi:hypothetical protein
MLIDDNGEGAAYLSRLKQSGSTQGAATATAPALKTHSSKVPPETATNAVNTRPEKRSSPRYKCKGSARMIGTGGIVSTWATLADISVHGCYIETPSPNHVGDFVGLKLEANGFQIQATGEVRTAYPGVGMGVFFTRMSEPDRARLRELVKSISQPSVILGAARTPAAPSPDALRAASNPDAVLQALLNFFKDRHVMGREEFLSILRKNQ